LTSDDLITKNIDDDKQITSTKNILIDELNETSSISVNDNKVDSKLEVAQKNSTTTENKTVERIEELSESEDKSSRLISNSKVASEDISKDKNLDAVKELDNQNKLSADDLTAKNIDDNNQSNPSKEKFKSEFNDTSSFSLNDKKIDSKSEAAEKILTTKDNKTVAKVEELSEPESQNKLTSDDLISKNIDNNKQNKPSNQNLKDELNDTSSITFKDESQSITSQIDSNQLSKRTNDLEPELLSARNTDSQNNTEVNIDEKKLAFNKDFSGVKDNIKSFSNSLSDDEDDESIDLFQQRNSNNSKKTREIVIPGKIEKNVPLKTGTVDVSAMTIKNNGDFVETARANKTHAIRVNFKMYKNERIAPGNKEIFIVIQNPKGKVINEKGTFELRTGVEIPFSDETVAYYDGNNISISILSDRFVQKFVKGTYVVKIFIERYLTGQTLLILS